LNPNDLLKMYPEAAKLKNQLEKSLKEKTFKISSKDGKVTINMNGKQEITGLTINRNLLDPSKAQILKSNLIEATNHAIKSARDSMLQEAMKAFNPK
jgi:DNA-binding YbaB/EbfC family protein